MVLELRQSLKLTQQLIMTPQLQQAIKLLQLSRLELAEVIQQEMNENPVLDDSLEEPEPADEQRDQNEMMEGYSESGPPAEEKPESNDELVNLIKHLDKQSFRDHPTSYADDDRADMESVLQKPTSLYDHLISQLMMARPEKELEMACILLIGNLNENGYLNDKLETLTTRNRLDPDLMKRALKMVQSFDPVGVGAQDLRECLMLQIVDQGLEDTLMAKVVDQHIGHLEKRNYKAIASALKVPLAEIGKALKQIETLEPKPGRPFGGQQAQYITPDIYVYKVGDEYVIQLNDDGLPKLKISNYYRKVLDNKDSTSAVDREYIQDKLRSAVWLIRSIHQRQRTIYRVTQAIVEFQQDFLDKGVAHLRPLILRDIAEQISMHESTISRVTSNKYVHTPQGIFELKYFFNSGINSSNGESFASESVKNEIKNIIMAEKPEKPFSDQEIVKLLREKDIVIARRTVTKYREMMSILSSTKRRKVF